MVVIVLFIVPVGYMAFNVLDHIGSITNSYRNVANTMKIVLNYAQQPPASLVVALGPPSFQGYANWAGAGAGMWFHNFSIVCVC